LLLLRFLSLRLFLALLQSLLLLLTGKRLRLFLLFGLHAVAEVRQPGLDRLLRFHPAMEATQKLVYPPQNPPQRAGPLTADAKLQ
jgi:hypothetical protein